MSRAWLCATVRSAGAASAVVVGVQTMYLLALLLASSRRRRPVSPSGDPRPMTILVPAHDEEECIAQTVATLLAARYPAGLRRVVVIADNCDDATATRARDAGATVWERDDPQRPGKGPALAWAIERLRGEPAPPDWVVFVDADCSASPSLLESLAAHLAAGADGVQAEYVVANPGAATTAALRAAGFALVNGVRPRGKDALGLSCGLFGSGMAFPLRTLAQVPWDAFSVTEDREYHLRLVRSGRRVHFAAGGRVSSPMPLTAVQEASQHRRWESGNVVLARRWVVPLLLAGNAQSVHAGMELLVPPLSLLVAPLPAIWAAGALAGSPRLRRSALALFALQGVYVVGGLLSERVPRSVYRALLFAPVLVGRKLAQYGRIGCSGGAADWERTVRS